MVKDILKEIDFHDTIVPEKGEVMRTVIIRTRF